LPGEAGATPVVWDDRIFLTSADGDDLVLLCASTEGRELWRRAVSPGANKAVRGDEGNYASPSPSTDGKHVWAFMANGATACYDLDGNLKWKTDLQERYGKFEIQFGLSSTPIVDADRIYLQLIHGKWNPTPSVGFVVCLDKSTGEEVWQHVRKTDAIDECKQSYASPFLYRDAERSFLISHGADFVIGHDLKTGNEIWRCGGLNSKSDYVNTLRFVASPVAVPGLIVVPTAKSRKVVAIRPDAKGDITDSKSAIAWVMPRRTPDVPSPVIHDGIVYLCRENGVLIALDATTGKQLYEERTVKDRHRASPIWAGGKVYLTARSGMVTVVKAGREFEILAQNNLGEPTTASLAVADGTLYVRTFDALYAIRQEPKKK
jgi:outer membrane protein assembly factor BamB